MENKKSTGSIIAAFVILVAFACVSIGMFATGTGASGSSASASDMSLWSDDSYAAEQLTSYMANITDEGSADYIPVENRIAVFDMDGTLYCETDPVYFDHMLLYHRVIEDEDYADKATDTEKEVAKGIAGFMETGEYPEGMDTDHGTAVATAFAGMTLDEFNEYVKEYKETPMESYDGMTLGEAWYRPMVQLIEYLQENDFTVYIVSGTDRLIVRGLVEDSPLDLPNSQLIGSDELFTATNQGDEDGMEYTYTYDDDVILGGEFVVKNLKMNKVTVIAQEIGEQPVLSFGNSTGDAAMATYVTDDNPYKSMAFMLCCDDTERENGNVEKAEKMRSLCEENGWVPVSMKDDWKTIYGDGVTYTGGE